MEMVKTSRTSSQVYIVNNSQSHSSKMVLGYKHRWPTPLTIIRMDFLLASKINHFKIN
jgi:hypothetical protein